MQVATLDAAGFPALCHVWFHAVFVPDRLYFMSRPERNHSVNIRADCRVAAGMTLSVPEGLGRPVRGVTLTGTAEQVPDSQFRQAADGFVARWPAAAQALRPADGDDPASAPSRIYRIDVAEWVLFDEVNFPGRPRIVLPAA
jgi:Pyridoxamine 5'-phosphate oxidase